MLPPPNWSSLALADNPAGFPAHPGGLAVVQLPGAAATDTNPRDFVVVFGGGLCPVENPATVGLSDVFYGQSPEEGASDLWVSPIVPPACGHTTQAAGPSLKSFHRAVLAFPPKARRGFSLTPLDASGRRLMLFGGHDGRGCLNDVQILEFPANSVSSEAGAIAVTATAVAEAPNSDDDSEPEEIFFASNYRSQVKVRSKAPKAGKTAAPPSSWPKGAGPPPKLPTTRCSEDSDGSDSDSSEGSGRQEWASQRFAPSSGRSVLPCNLESVMSTLGCSSKVKHTKMEVDDPESDALRTERQALKEAAQVANAAKWRTVSLIGSAPCSRAGHATTLQGSGFSDDVEEACVLVHGGVSDGGHALSDAYTVRILDTDGVLEAMWDRVGDNVCDPLARGPWACLRSQPPGRAFHSAVFWPGDTQQITVVFGGVGLGPADETQVLGDVWTLANGEGPSVWMRPVTTGSQPAPRWGHSAVLVGGADGCGAVMVLSGGCDAHGQVPTDCWHLDLEDMRWEQILLHSPSWEPSLFSSACKDATAGPPPASGGCKGAWARSLAATIVWGGQGPIVWHELDGPRRRRGERQALRNNLLCQEKLRHDKEERKQRRREEKEERKRQKEETHRKEEEKRATIAGQDKFRAQDSTDERKQHWLQKDQQQSEELSQQSILPMETLYAMQEVLTLESAREMESSRVIDSARATEASKKVVIPKKPTEAPTGKRPKRRPMPTSAAAATSSEKVIEFCEPRPSSPHVVAWSEKAAFDVAPPFDRLAFDKVSANSASGGIILRKPENKISQRCLTPRTLPPMRAHGP